MQDAVPLKLILSPEAVEDLLELLCVDLGFCLYSPEYDELCENPPDDITSFVNSIYAAEHLDPAVADQTIYRQVCAYVQKACDRAQAIKRGQNGNL